MYRPTREEFLKLTKKGNVIPVYKEINADLDTPVSAYLKVNKGDYSFLFESVEGMERIARYSFLGNSPSLIFKSKSRNIRMIYPQRGKTVSFVTKDTPLDEIKKIMHRFKSVSVPGLPRFYGGLVGYIGYDSARFFEKIADKNPDDIKVPDVVMILTDTLLIFDHLKHSIKIVTNCLLPKASSTFSRRQKINIYEKALKKIEAIQKDFNSRLIERKPKPDNRRLKTDLSSNFKKGQFCRMVKAAKDYIKKGDVIQVVLSQRFKIRIKKEPFEIYRTLRSLNPSPYMFFLKLKDMILAGSSPEMLVRCEDGLIQTRPIAGTRPRGKTQREDKRLADELSNDAKEKAEHLMLVDLGRNDLGRVSKTGRVRVSEFMNVEKYSHVMHLVSEVRATLDKKRFDIYDVLRAAFPAGTVSGSPKIRAMEIIDELENIRRGPYAGCVGYFGFSHNMDTCITIRTILVKGRYGYIQAGAGIVADSIPEKEYEETVNKAKALIEAH
ncbi:MAG: anthranilate synthase component I [Candidatus Omnitrophota bacterium]|nr:anthranilate synthase component I [Candidatus Omnitrophota bacterium]